MNLIKGLNKSSGILGLTTGESPHARNMVYQKNESIEGISNEEGFLLYYDHPKCILGIIPTNEGRDIVFSGRYNLGETSEIGVINNGTYTPLIVDNELKFLEPIEGTYYYNNKGQLIVKWCDGVKENSNVPRILNIDCLPFKLNVDKSFINDDDVNMLAITPKVNLVSYNLLSVNNTGGTLKTGAYFFNYAIQYEDNTISNFYNMSNPVFINLDTSDLFNGFNGNEPGLDTSKSIKIKINNLSVHIKKITLGIIKKINGVYTAAMIPDIIVNNGVVDYLYSGYNEITSSPEDILIGSAPIVKAETLTQLNNRVYLGNVQTTEIPNIQPFVNGIQVEYVFQDSLIMSEKPNSNKDMVFMFNKRGFKSNEVYAFYFIGHLPTGEMIAFNIPGRAPLTINYIDEQGNTFVGINENDLISNIISQHPTSKTMLQALEINPDARVHEVLNTANLSGRMSYWENQDEFYPDTECYDIKNSTNNIVGTLRNLKVRHHKFPTLGLLKNLPGAQLISGTNREKLRFLKVDLESGNLATGFDTVVSHDDNSTDFLTTDFTDKNNLKLTLVKDCKLRIKFKAVLNLLNSSSGGSSIGWSISKGSLTTRIFEHAYAEDGITDGILNYIDVEGKKGDIITLYCDMDGGACNSPSYFEVEDWNFDTYNVESKVLGVKLKNINIPPEVQARFVRFELGYAERTEENMTITAMAPALPSSDGLRYRTYPIDILTFRKVVDFDYLQVQLAYKTQDGIVDFTDERASSVLRKAYEGQYIPFNGTAIVNNKEKEEHVYLRVEEAITLPGGFSAPNTRYILDLKKYKTQVFLNTDIQNVVRTNQYINVNSNTSSNLYGGDTFFNLVGWYQVNQVNSFEAEDNNAGSGGKYWSLPLKEDETDARYYVDAQVSPLETIVNGAYFTSNDTTRYALENKDMTRNALDSNGQPVKQFAHYDNKFSYNKDYNSILNFLEVLVRSCRDNCGAPLPFKFPHRIYKSTVNNLDSDNLNWRKFRINDYYEIVKNKGEISVLRSINRTLLINTWFSFFVAGPKDLLATDSVNAYLSTGDIFDRPPEEQVTDIQGYGGCQNKFSAFVCKMGYFFVDRNQGKPFIFNGKLIELTDSRSRNYFRDLISFDYPELNLDNPFYSKGLTAAFDEKHNRIILSKIARISFEEPSGNNFTMSYSFLNNSWISDHDYLPSYLYYSRKGLFSLDNGQPGSVGKIYLHNQLPTPVYYDGIIKPYFIDIAINSPDSENVVWHSVEWESYAKTGNIPTDSATFTHIFVYNDHQCTQLTALNKLATLPLPVVNLRNEVQKFRFNKLEDFSLNPNLAMVDSKGNIAGNINAIKAYYKRGRFFGRTIIVRFYDNNNLTNKVMTLIKFGANSTEFQR